METAHEGVVGPPAPPRIGARHPSLVPKEVLRSLELGHPSVNHMEQIAFDMGALLQRSFPDLAGQAVRLRTGGLVAKMRIGGLVLFEAYGADSWQRAASHDSDTVRGWGAMSLGSSGLPLAELLEEMEVFADDSHFAVREWAWLGVRSRIIAEPLEAVVCLAARSLSRSPRVRRFASEATRPRGVWSAHVPLFKENPAIASAVLEPLREDQSEYVQLSVGNWLNDASKSQPKWVERTCREWLKDSRSDATRRICRRGMRSLG